MNAQSQLPSRLHHNAYVVKDLEVTRQFYEDLLGFRHTATWCEKTNLFGKERVYCHCFFSIADDSALAFFQFATEEDQNEFGPELPPSGFRHIALKVEEDQLRDKIKLVKESGYPEDKFYFLEHGYCHSLYIIDPDGLIVEFCSDHPDVEQINKDVAPIARSELERWLAGDHTPNNEAYHRQEAV